ncbi:diguanylate cyclase [Falsirhodobacter halotolerans]|uniref:diguanylate cyclase n=1 Tax=Falsirhodobacter halotolerans TaxID=1146892 RepID=UPI001FD229A1|nr:diguanylate cyclase [Falsirhodobacter halotolerans]MCJ8140466.1 diguanylate cyclase [Falsirhodobacter halotolerans]
MTGRILVIDPVPTSRIVTKLRLTSGCYLPTIVDSVEEAIPVARRDRPGAILIESSQPLSDLERMRRDPRLRDIPMIVFSPIDRPAVRLTALKGGAVDVMTKPVDDRLMLARLRAVLRRSAEVDELGTDAGLAEDGTGFEHPPAIALVAARPEGMARLRADLAPRLGGHLSVITREEALNDAGRVPDLYIIEADLNGMGGGLRLMSDLRARSATRHVPVCIVNAAPRPETAAMAWDLGADEVMAVPTDPAELALRLQALLRGKRVLDRRRASVANGLRMAMVDPLTGLHNRRFALPRMAAMAQGDMAVMLIDLDHFKSVNDRFGHAAGDTVLAEVARRLTTRLRPGDLAARIGGEEFLIALPDTKLATARDIADRLCADIGTTPVHLPSGQTLRVTVSVGIATRRRYEPETVTDTMDRADRALLQSKAAGRNQVTVGSCLWGTARTA